MTMKRLIAVPVRPARPGAPRRQQVANRGGNGTADAQVDGAGGNLSDAGVENRLSGRPRATRRQSAAADRARAPPPAGPASRRLAATCRRRGSVYDPHPTFNGMAVDPANNVVIMSDENRGSLLSYNLTDGADRQGQRPSRTGTSSASKVNLGFIAGVTVDPGRREMYTVNNDGGGLVVHSYDSHGDVAPIRELTVPHQSWGLSLDVKNDELAVTSQQYQGISIYSRTATKTDRPIRTIRGDKTMLADPHGVFLDPVGREVFAANHGNWTEMRTYSADGPPLLVGEYIPGRFEKPSIRVYQSSADGNVPPIRTMQGPQTQLAWPMGITVDAAGGRTGRRQLRHQRNPDLHQVRQR